MYQATFLNGVEISVEILSLQESYVDAGDMAHPADEIRLNILG